MANTKNDRQKLNGWRKNKEWLNKKVKWLTENKK
jgi:hypothetical protein